MWSEDSNEPAVECHDKHQVVPFSSNLLKAFIAAEKSSRSVRIPLIPQLRLRRLNTDFKSLDVKEIPAAHPSGTNVLWRAFFRCGCCEADRATEVDLFMTGNNCQHCHYLAGFSRGAGLTAGQVCVRPISRLDRETWCLSFIQPETASWC